MLELFVAFFVMTLVFLLGALYGWNVHERFMDRRVSEVMQAVNKSLSKDVIHIDIEKHNDMIYIYNKQDKTFMAQGKDRDEVEAALAEKFPGKRFAATTEDLELGFGDAKSI